MAIPHPRAGASIIPASPLKEPAVSVPVIWFNLYFSGIFLMPALNRAAAKIIIRAIGRCNTPSGNPTIALDMRWPADITKPPSRYPHAAAAKKPGAESSATVPVGLGSFKNDPSIAIDVKIAIRATLLVFQ
ncbi:MAG: hypothetical protein BTN85_2136 [Candidatus Methanohalarchaeum thermophilum]|uniref:Uncharacterized protein n=1 Tax=Methanohalarchaeum thermophilum TaxID=1903181 RepID=A0A1Q6DSY3_METT1|nr:MAG: hypothetical protein BTN85_2136 [Candidatus Methanohalarchaeum thermophilum]